MCECSFGFGNGLIERRTRLFQQFSMTDGKNRRLTGAQFPRAFQCFDFIPCGHRGKWEPRSQLPGYGKAAADLEGIPCKQDLVSRVEERHLTRGVARRGNGKQ